MSDELTIRRASSVQDYLACQNAQRLAWGIQDDSYVIPLATMVGAQLHGGIVLGAFLPTGEAVGMSFGFLGRTEEGRICFYSQLTGVVPGRQSGGLGYRLKLAQREIALAEGVALMAWAFDPLQARNASFNLVKLGTTCGRYVDDMYGRRSDQLNQGVATDRLIAEWDLKRPLPTTKIETACSPGPDLSLITSTPREDGFREVISQEPISLNDAAETLLVEIPAEIGNLRQQDPALAERWRCAVRGALVTAFQVGYRAVGMRREAGGGDSLERVFYRLSRAGQGD